MEEIGRIFKIPEIEGGINTSHRDYLLKRSQLIKSLEEKGYKVGEYCHSCHEIEEHQIWKPNSQKPTNPFFVGVIRRQEVRVYNNDSELLDFIKNYSFTDEK